MVEKNYTIPINEQFDKMDGCPMCKLFDKLEKQSVEYVMGAAMMEPNVRIETNKTGFCEKHYRDMLAMSNRLSLALLLESYIQDIQKLCELPAKPNKKEMAERVAKFNRAADGCFVCERVANTMEKYSENIIYLWKAEPEFRQKFNAQPMFCYEHSALLMRCAHDNLNHKLMHEFAADMVGVMKKKLDKVSADVSRFCKSFDYRNAGTELGDAKYAVENAIEYLTGTNL